MRRWSHRAGIPAQWLARSYDLIKKIKKPTEQRKEIETQYLLKLFVPSIEKHKCFAKFNISA